MITTLSGLVEYSKHVAKEFPNDTNEILLKQPGLSEAEQIELIAILPQLPDSYLEVASKVGLLGIRSGYFAFWPEAFGDSSFIESLGHANSNVNPYFQRLNERGLIQIANWEAEPIVVSSKFIDRKGGEVFKVSIGSRELSLTKLASTFEMFLILVGNLDEVSTSFEDYDAVQEFERRLLLLTQEESIRIGWRQVCDVVLLSS